MKTVLSIILIFLTSNIVFANETFLKVFDKETKQPLAYANVCFQSVSSKENFYFVTSLNGETKNPVKEKSKIVISFVGYETLIDTINPNEAKVYYLQPDVFNMEQVVITATRTEKALKDAPVITQVITAKQIESRGLETVQDVLEADMPGIEFQRHGGSSDINIQGISAKNVLILIDGERMAGETRGNVDYSRLNTNDVKRIEIIKGASSALYGSQAMGAVINIITKTSKQKFYVNISSKYKAYNEINYPNLSKSDENYNFEKNLDKPNLNINAVTGFNIKKFSSKTNFVIKSTDAYQLYDRDSLIKEYINLDTIIYEAVHKTPTSIEGTQDFSINQKFEYRFNNKLSLETNGTYYNHHKYDFYKDKKHDFYDDFSYGLKAFYKPDEGKSIVFSYHSDIYNKYDYLEKLDEKVKNYSQQYQNPKITGNYKIGEKQMLTAGLEYLHEVLESDMFVYGEMQEKQVSNSVVFLQNDIKINPKLNIIAGIRGEYHTSYGEHFTPKLSLMYKWLPLTFRLNYAAGYRSPGLKELYMNWRHLGMFTIEGNENLKPETNNYFSASVNFSKLWINTSVNVYKNYFNNKIDGQWAKDQTILKYQNIEKSSLFGIDYLSKVKLSKAFIIKGGYSYVYDKNSNNGLRLSGVSPHNANLQLEYKFKKGFYELLANITGKYIGAKDFDVLDEFEYRGEAIEEYYKMHYDDYSILKFSVSQRFYNSVNLVIGVDNLFDYTADIVTFNTSTTPGRRYFISLNVAIEKLYKQFKSN
ncbi:MAG: TonB-dependent receptor [Bacteroidetes bacterium]|nr:TonB-dependent receptor [Bacteroidota bacterium]